MDGESEPQADKTKPQSGSLTSEGIKSGDSQSAKETAAYQLAKVERDLSGFEKSTLRWARTAVIMSGLAAIFVCAQWWEMHTGSEDTHLLAMSASNQAFFTREEARNMKELANKTKQVADQALIQATTARQAFEAEARPYVGFQVIVLKRDDIKKLLTFGATLNNSGKIPTTRFMVNCVVMRGKTKLPIQKSQNAATKRSLNPGEQSGYFAGIGASAFDAVVTGGQKLDIYIDYTYHWRREKESKCEKAEYDPFQNLFLELGEECPPQVTH